MRLEQLKYYIITADRGSISLAAKELNLAQQTLSSSIKNLEDEIGAALFFRNKQGVLKTVIGERFYNFAVKTIYEYETFQNFVCNPLSSKSSGEIKVLSLNSYKSNILPALKVYFMKNYPNIRLDIQIAEYQDILELLIQNKVDVAIMHLAHHNYYEIDLLPDNINFHSLFNSELYFWVSNSSPLSTNKTISSKQIKKNKIALSADADLFLLEELFVSTGTNVVQNFDVFYEYSTICKMVENNLAICPDIKMNHYGFILEKMFQPNTVTPLLFKSSSAKKLTTGYLTSTNFESSSIYYAIKGFFNSII